MLKYIILPLFVLFSQLCFKQTSTVAIESRKDNVEGFVFININKLYHKEERITIVGLNNDTIVYLKNKLIKINDRIYEIIKEEHEYNKLINIEAYYPEYNLFVLKCYGTKNDSYIIEINGSIGLLNKSEVNGLIEFKNLQRYIMETFPLPSKDNPVYTKPNQNSSIIKDFDKLTFIPIEIKGDWVKIKDSKDCYSGEFPSSVDVIGWIRWRKNGEILLKVSYRC